MYCGKNLLEPPSGIVVLWRGESNDKGGHHTSSVYWCCKGACDAVLRQRHKDGRDLDTGEDIADLAIPSMYLRWNNGLMREFGRGGTYAEGALDKMALFMTALFPHVSRELREEEEERLDVLRGIPEFLGGLG